MGPEPAGSGEQAGLSASPQSGSGVPCAVHQPEPHSRVIISALRRVPAPLRPSRRAPLRPRSPGHPAHPFPRPPGPPCLSCPAPPAARRRLLLRWQSRGLPQQTCHPTPRKRAAPSRLLFVPPPDSALGRRLLPRSAVEVRGAGLGPDAPRVPSIWPAPNQGPFCLVFPMWTPRGAGRRRCAQPGAGAGLAAFKSQGPPAKCHQNPMRQAPCEDQP
ncbi:vegetative cell wall protein gp1-like [Ailuropoda melanoleuca]|uniref:vegetative cell wall protein gp1-like n=1 Tax=Ailuropoda melanoleuca TaxID=9646 RepID=UPI001494F1F5|nr:vegetative cell wall protein gp1-like [Ailuropoda melanoleuca]